MPKVDLPASHTSKVSTARGFIDDREVPIDVEGEATEGGETRLELRSPADWAGELPSITAYLGPVEAVVLGERLVAAGRQALADVIAEVPSNKKR